MSKATGEGSNGVSRHRTSIWSERATGGASIVNLLVPSLLCNGFGVALMTSIDDVMGAGA